jgi:hypothetical protein
VTLKEAAKIVRAFGLSFRVDDGEIRIALKDGTKAQNEASAYYTDDVEDAVNTAFAMHKQDDPHCTCNDCMSEL